MAVGRRHLPRGVARAGVERLHQAAVLVHPQRVALDRVVVHRRGRPGDQQPAAVGVVDPAGPGCRRPLRRSGLGGGGPVDAGSLLAVDVHLAHLDLVGQRPGAVEGHLAGVGARAAAPRAPAVATVGAVLGVLNRGTVVVLGGDRPGEGDLLVVHRRVDGDAVPTGRAVGAELRRGVAPRSAVAVAGPDLQPEGAAVLTGHGDHTAGGQQLGVLTVQAVLVPGHRLAVAVGSVVADVDGVVLAGDLHPDPGDLVRLTEHEHGLRARRDRGVARPVRRLHGEGVVVVGGHLHLAGRALGTDVQGLHQHVVLVHEQPVPGDRVTVGGRLGPGHLHPADQLVVDAHQLGGLRAVRRGGRVLGQRPLAPPARLGRTVDRAHLEGVVLPVRQLRPGHRGPGHTPLLGRGAG